LLISIKYKDECAENITNVYNVKFMDQTLHKFDKFNELLKEKARVVIDRHSKFSFLRYGLFSVIGFL